MRSPRPIRRTASTPRPPSIRTPRLVLRQVEPVDTARVALVAGDPAVAHHLDRVPTPFPYALAAHWIARRISRWRDRRGVTFAITRPPRRALIGAVSLRIARRRREAELGYWLAAESWGQGLATEAAAAMIDWAFDRLDLRRVSARVLEDNTASRRVLAKLGLVGDGRLPRPFRRGGELVEVLEVAVTRDAWLVPVRTAKVTAPVRTAKVTAPVRAAKVTAPVRAAKVTAPVRAPRQRRP